MSGSDGDREGDSVPEPAYRRFDCTTGDPVLLAEATEAARTAIENGECVVLPTDTVYGIAADAFSGDAVQRLLDAKLRGRDMPPPVLIAEPSLIRALATDVPDAAKDLVEKHWPGPLTVILRRQPSLRMDLGDTEGTVALRVPDHALARDVLRSTGPMAVSSANLSGQPAALSVDEAIEQLGGSVAVYLDGGPAGGDSGAPSTIVDFTQADTGHILRRGALSVDVIRETCPDVEDLTEPEPEPDPEPVDSEAVEAEPIGAEPVEAEPGTDPPAADEVGGQPRHEERDHETGPAGATAVVIEPPGPEAGNGHRSAGERATPTASGSIAETSQGPETGHGRDTGHPRDTGRPRDTGHPRDTGRPRDTVHPRDTGHEPDTDELGITHADRDPHQPDLFGAEDEVDVAERRTGRTGDA